MKKILATAIALLLLCPIIGYSMPDEKQPMSLAIGVTTQMNGFFFTNKWGMNPADVDLRELIHGHSTVSWTENGDYVINQTVVQALEFYENHGDKTYRFVFSKDLAYSDGTTITARDYAFSALLLSSREFAVLGGASTELSYLRGFDVFRAGAPFAGVRLIDDYTLELTIDGRFLPYFYEVVLLNLVPYPIHVLATGCSVRDEGSGAYIYGPFSDALLRETILDEESGYLRHPTVTAGPYTLLAFDGENQAARFVRNPYYTGNHEGVIPQIDEINVIHVGIGDALDSLESGRIGLISRISEGAVIADGLGRLQGNTIRANSYMRTGQSFISFACEMGPTQSANVRKAVAHCVDVHAINAEFTQGFGLPVYGYYGMGQWMAQENQEALQTYETPLNPVEAARLLELDGWMLGESGMRYRAREDGSLEKLALKWAQPQETAMSAALERAIRNNFESVGIELEIVRLPFNQMLAHYYRQVDREYHMMSLATNFNLAFDPYFAFHTGERYQGESNRAGLKDEQLMDLALAMRQTQVGDRGAYVEAWLAFQDRFNELQPMVPLFTNAHFDFYRADLLGYRSNAYVGVAQAIVYAHIGDPLEEKVEDEIVEEGPLPLPQDERWLLGGEQWMLEDEQWLLNEEIMLVEDVVY
ncbi:MAG: ABC transporter substrate-binding protein [Clostridia bacterium]|nr:ABC transporter substrate-binding protein [Clostridia bacterium]